MFGNLWQKIPLNHHFGIFQDFEKAKQIHNSFACTASDDVEMPKQRRNNAKLPVSSQKSPVTTVTKPHLTDYLESTLLEANSLPSIALNDEATLESVIENQKKILAVILGNKNCHKCTEKKAKKYPPLISTIETVDELDKFEENLKNTDFFNRTVGCYKDKIQSGASLGAFEKRIIWS